MPEVNSRSNSANSRGTQHWSCYFNVCPSEQLIDNTNSPNSVVNLNSSNSMNSSEWNTANEEQTKMMLKLMESVMALNERLISLLWF